MFGKKKLSGQDKTTKQLQSAGVYSLGQAPHPFVVENETVEAVKTKKIYSFWSGVWYTSILSILLFWIPPFGQMIAGYVGGRKAGNPRLGMLAALAPMTIIFLLFFLRYAGQFVTEIDWFLDLPGSGAEFMSTNLPIFGPVIGFMANYVETFVSAMWSHEFFIYPYVLTVIFGYVGGILSLQHRRELEAEGKDHPFMPIAFLPAQSMGSPIQPILEDAPPTMPSKVSEPEPEVEMGNVPKDWKLKKNKHKGKWK
ncbi:MAG: hypothetical protein Q7J68_07995 [Thermoplasmata archaeon]|nr:hypothetical protein [Thermoplasmata archaeon]